MGSSVFRFKKFSIHQDFCAMKVGTDSVILGSWANTYQAKTCLDIGTGTGLLSLMMAQKGIEKITAIDIDESACLQATWNVQNSIFKNHIEIINQSFQDFCIGHLKKYDHIISNPPFFKNSLRPNEQ
ncbi:MAG: tRNA1(Val) (adenine(37)-N6)-methyltransferase, partial [Bacteroidota bacterium]